MRLFLAAITFYASIMLFAVVICRERLTLLTVLAWRIFIPFALWRSYYLFRPHIPTREELELADLLSAVSYHGLRAFGIEDYNDEGPHYFIELQDGSIIYFVGQYLYEYEPIEDDDPEAREPRRFPCTDFTVYRHKEEGYTVDLEVHGKALEPEVIFRIKDPFYVLEKLLGRWPEDGDVITDWRYEDLRDALREFSK
ncbi:MAG: hypothetical protein RMI91_08810 [Gemmatales bacterium]|nr:hypothetical protein [Gemmatales bacterium]MDW7994740.1 hypothetical protein [Gemmatales bacterium]